MKTSIYRLHEYEITEYDNGVLFWKSHFGFAAEREGKCFLIGNILFLGPWSVENAGFFKREFFDHLKNLSQWEETDYYCPHVEIYSCDNSRKVSLEEVRHNLMRESSGRETALSTHRPSGNVPFSYRLNRYEIEMARDDRVSWKTWAGSNTIRSGRCFILEDILFIGSSAKQQTSFKKEFLRQLKSLPAWDRTRYYCRSYDLRPCKTKRGLSLEQNGGSPDIYPTLDQKGPLYGFPFAQKIASRDLIRKAVSKIHSYIPRFYDIALSNLPAFLSFFGALNSKFLNKLRHIWKHK